MYKIHQFEGAHRFQPKIDHDSIFEGCFRVLHCLSVPYITHGYIQRLNGIQLVPPHMSIRSDQSSQPIEQNNISSNLKHLSGISSNAKAIHNSTPQPQDCLRRIG